MEEWTNAIHERLTRSAAEGRFSGAVLVRTGAGAELICGYGEEDSENGVGNTPSTQFRLGSLNKMFTAIATAQLVQDGVISLTTRIADLLPDYPNKPVSAAVNVHQLLTHTSGLGDFWGAEFEAHKLKLQDCASYLAHFAGAAPLGAPEGQWRYSSLGYIVLGRMVEVASGRSYDDLVGARLFGPAGMENTGSLPESSDVPHRAVGYMRTAQGWTPNTDTLPYSGTPAGGGYSTVEDLDRFATALMRHTLLDEAHTDLTISPHVHAVEGMHYGYGFMIETRRGTRTIGHTGAARGMAAVFRVCPRGNWRVIVLSNRDAPAAQMVADSICDKIAADLT